MPWRGMCVSIAGDWGSSNPALAISRGPCGALGLACSPEPPLHRHALVPIDFRHKVRRLTQKHLSQLLLPAAGIRPAVFHGARFPAPRSSTGGSQHFAAIRSRFVSTVSFILSLHRGLSLPLHGARVAPERVICRQPLPPVNGSPVLRVLSTGLTSARSLDRPCLGGLSGPTGLRLNRTDLPCSRPVLRLHASGTNPGSVPAHSPYRSTEMLPSP